MSEKGYFVSALGVIFGIIFGSHLIFPRAREGLLGLVLFRGFLLRSLEAYIPLPFWKVYPDFYIGRLGEGVYLLIIIIAVVLFLLIKKEGFVKFICLFLIFSSISALNYFTETKNIKSLSAKGVYTYRVEGRVNSQPKKDNNKSSFFLKVYSVNNKPTDGFLWVNVKKKINAVFGDEIKIAGNFSNPKQEDFQKYLFMKRVKDVLFVNKVIDIKPTFLSTIGNLQKKIESLYKKDDDSEAFLLASFIGNTSTLSEESKNDFKTSGLAHLWSVSGLHVGYLILFMLFLTRMTGLRPLGQVTLTTLALLAYSFLASLSPPVVRSAIMGFVVLLCWYLGRKKDLVSILMLTFITMLIYDPLMIYDIGFQLSFASVFGILILAHLIEKLFRDWPSFLKTAVAVSVSAQISTTPFLIYHFGIVPVYSIVANIFAVPLVMPMMILIFFYSLFFWMPGGYLFKTFAKLPSKVILFIASSVSNLPFSRLFIEKPVYVFLLLIVCFVGAYLIKKHKISLATAIILITALVTSSLFVQTSSKPSGFEVVFLDVGQGDAALVRDKNSTILIDGGPDYNTVYDKLSRRGISKVDIVILSHPNADHLNGLIEVVKNYKIGLFVNSGYPQPSFLYKELLSEIKKRNIKYLRARAGKMLILGDMKIEIFNPPDELLKGTEADDNNNSIVCKIEHKNISVLFTGDIQEETEKLLVNKYKSSLKADILKVAHHGSAYSTTNEFLEAVKPKYSTISAGKDNPYGHPSGFTLGRLIKDNVKIYRTDISGDLTIREEGNGLTIGREN